MYDYKFYFTCPNCSKEAILELKEYHQKAITCTNCGSTFPYSDQCTIGRIEHDHELYCKCLECNKVSAFRHGDYPHEEVACPYCGSTVPNERCVKRKKNDKVKHVPPLLFFLYNDRMEIEEKANKILRATLLEEEPDRAFVQWSKKDKTEDERKNLISPSEIPEHILKPATRIDIELIRTKPKLNMISKTKVSSEEFKSSKYYGLQCRICALFKALKNECDMTSKRVCKFNQACSFFLYR